MARPRSSAPPTGCRWSGSTIVRAHPYAAGAPKRGVGALRGPGVGRSRGGLTAKIPLRVNAWGLPMRADVTPGQTSEHRGFDLVVGDDLPAPAALLGDKGYDADRIRAWAEARDAMPVIPMRRCRRARRGVDRALCALRNHIERCIGRLKHSRRIATRYHKTATSFLGLLGFLDLARIRM